MILSNLLWTDLKALAQFLSVSVSGVGSEELAKRCMKAIADRCGVKVKTRRNREVKLTSELPPLVISTHERADVLVYNEDGSKVALLIEVNSSHMLFTERKAVLGAADMIRFLRNSNIMFSGFTSFVFPKIGSRQCIIKVTVKWQELRFVYSLQRLPDMQEALDAVQDVLKCQMSAVPTLPEAIEHQLMLLSQDDLNWISSDDPFQVPSSRNIIVADCRFKVYVMWDRETLFAIYNCCCTL